MLSLQKHEKINFCCLSHPVYSILFLQPEQTQAPRKDHILGNKTHLNKFQRIETIQSMLLAHEGIEKNPKRE
jgi:hypothetical protein